MTGKVYIINHQIGWIGILTENNYFTIAEVLEMTLPSIGDILTGELESLGGENLFNHSSQEEVDVFIQDIYANRGQAMRQLQIFNNNRNQWEML